MRRRSNQAAVVWDGGTEDFICRDERCTLYEVHLAHDINDTPEVLAARQSLWGWMFDPIERPRKTQRPKPEALPCPRCAAEIGMPCDTVTGRAHRQRLRQSPEWLAAKSIVRQAGTSDRRTNKPAHVQVLDDCILRAITPLTIKPYTVIESEVWNDYGSCANRRLHRRLAALRDEGAITYLRLGSDFLSGYTMPGSPLLDDLLHAEEILWSQIGELGMREAAA